MKKGTIGQLHIASDFLDVSKAHYSKAKLQETYFGVNWLWYKQDKSLKFPQKQTLEAVLLLMTNWTKKGLTTHAS